MPRNKQRNSYSQKMPAFRIKRTIVCVLPLLFFVSCNQRETLFRSLPASKTNVSFVNRPMERERFSILYYLYYYNGGGVATGDVNNDNLPDIFFTANTKGGNKLYLNKGGFVFEDITEKAGVAGNADWSSGVTMADVNGDGLTDIYVSTVSNRYGLTGHNELFINNGNGTFKESSAQYGLNTSCFTTQSAFFDYDHDGDLDCYLLNQSHHPHANVVDTANRRKYDPLSGDRLYRNDVATTGKFTDVSSQAGIYQSSLGYGLGLAVADLNNDGWEDVYVGNDFHENDYYYVNNGNGTFTESGAKHFYHYSRFSMGNDAADYNNDGQLDLVTVDMLPPDEKTLKTYGSDENADIYNIKLISNGYQHQYSRNCLQRNNGNGESFSDVGLMSGVSATDWSWSSLFADFDNDGAKDLFITSGIVKRPVDLDYIRFASDMKLRGSDKTDAFDKEVIDQMPDGASHPFFFKGDGKLSFKDESEAWGTAELSGYYTGAAYADLDNDGDLDVVINPINALAVVLQNNSPAKNQLTLNFKGNGANTQGIGAKAYLFAGGKMQYQQLMPTRGFQSACEARLHFGLDAATAADSLLILWPDQSYQVVRNVKANQRLAVSQKEASGRFNAAAFFGARQTLLAEEPLAAEWMHREDPFVDYNVQYLIPHAQSTRGPKMAVADVNGDGLDDYYACGAAGQAGALMLQNANGSFSALDTAVFSPDKDCEDVDALFFDANGDKAPDLYVVSGGNRYADGSAQLLDRLYLNNGKGAFAKAAGLLPAISKNKSCITAADVDRDGDNDLFVGTLANPRAYGLPQTSALLLNDGKGKFSAAAPGLIPLNEIGMITTASFSDFNNDGWSDLAVAGEWMPVKIFLNNRGKFAEISLPSSTGLWQTLYPTDVNGDGFTDLLAGNWGYNTKLHAGKNGPCKLYVKDFDKNGSSDQLLCYTIDGKEYTFLVKDELERSLPVLKKHYLTYKEVAGKTVSFLLDDLFTDYAELQAEVLASSVFINDGKGSFQRMDLPAELQLAPVMSFGAMPAGGKTQWMAAGNFYGAIPYEGRYDALQPSFLRYDKAAKQFVVTGLLPQATGEVRDLKWLARPGGKKLLAMGLNNDRIKFFTTTTP